MKKIIFLLLLSAFVCNIGFAQSQSNIQVTGDISGIRTLSRGLADGKYHFQRSRKSARKVKLKIYGKELGATEITLNKIRYKDWKSYFQLDSTTAYDLSDIILVEGTIKTKHGVVPVGGSIYKYKGTPTVFLIGNAKKPTRDFFMQIPLKLRGARLVGSISTDKNLRGEHLDCGAIDRPTSGDAGLSSADTGSSRISLRNTSKTAKIHTQADHAYYAAYSTATNNHIATIIAGTNAIFKRDIDVYVTVGTQHAYVTSAGDPFTSSDPFVLLPQMRNKVIADGLLNTASAYFLFSGKDFDGSVIGLAWVSTVCLDNSYAVGAVQKFYPASDVSLFAHELGHIFGARHDCVTSGSCSDPRGLMTPVISIPGSNHFGPASITEMLTHLSGRTCLNSNPTPTPTPGAPTATPTPTATPLPMIKTLPLRLYDPLFE